MILRTTLAKVVTQLICGTYWHWMMQRSKRILRRIRQYGVDSFFIVFKYTGQDESFRNFLNCWQDLEGSLGGNIEHVLWWSIIWHQQKDMGPDGLLLRHSSASREKKSISLLFVYHLPLFTAILDCTLFLLWVWERFYYQQGVISSLSVSYQRVSLKGQNLWWR